MSEKREDDGGDKENEAPEKKIPTAMDLYSTFIGRQASEVKPFDNRHTKPPQGSDIAKSLGKK